MTHEDVVAREKMSVGCAVEYLVYDFLLLTQNKSYHPRPCVW